MLFAYPAKGGVPRAVALKDPLLHKMVDYAVRRRGGGDDLLVYRNGRRDWHDVRAEDLERRGEGAGGRRVHLQGPAHVRTRRCSPAVTLAAGTAEGGVPRLGTHAQRW